MKWRKKVVKGSGQRKCEKNSEIEYNKSKNTYSKQNYNKKVKTVNSKRYQREYKSLESREKSIIISENGAKNRK